MDIIDDYYSNKDLSTLKKLTLIIPTYNRCYYPSRGIWYHAHFPFRKIILVDSSNNEKQRCKNEKMANSISYEKDIDIEYITYNPRQTKYSEGFDWKIAFALNHVDTKYSQVIADKEFAIPTTIAKGIEYLESHKDYGSVDGKYYSILSKGKQHKYNFQQAYLNQNKYDTKCSIPYSSAITRYLVSISSDYASTNLMSLRRSEIHKRVYSNLLEYNIDDIRFGEFIPEFQTIINSKHKYLSEIPFNCRDLTHYLKNGAIIKKESSCSRHPFLDVYIEDGIYDECLTKGVLCLRDELIKNGCELPVSEIEEIIRNTLPIALERRGYYGLSNKQKIISKIMSNRIISYTIQNMINHIEQNKKISEKIVEFNMIEHVIKSTEKYYKEDKPINILDK